MKLNRSQQLVHDNATMEKFRRDHNIPNDVAIERLGPREEANTIEGNGNHIPVRIWLIHQAGLIFLISPLLKEVMARCRPSANVCQLRPNRAHGERVDAEGGDAIRCFRSITCILHSAPEMRHIGTYVHRQPLSSTLKTPSTPNEAGDAPNKDMYLNEFVWVSGSWEFQAGDDGLRSFPRYNGYNPAGFNSRLWKRFEQCTATIEAESTPSTSSASSLGLSSSSGEVEKGEEVNQGDLPIPVPFVSPAQIPIVEVLVVISGSEIVSDLAGNSKLEMMASGPFPDIMDITQLGSIAGYGRGSSSALLLLKRLAVKNYGRTRKVAELLNCMPLYHHICTYQADRLRQVRLPELDLAEQESTPSTSSASSLGLSSSSGEVEKGEEVNQGDLPIPVPFVSPAQIPIVEVLVVISGSEIVSDLGFPPVLPADEDEIEHSFNICGANLDFSTEMAPKLKDIALKKKKKGKGPTAKTIQGPLPVQDPVLTLPNLPIVFLPCPEFWAREVARVRWIDCRFHHLYFQRPLYRFVDVYGQFFTYCANCGGLFEEWRKEIKNRHLWWLSGGWQWLAVAVGSSSVHCKAKIMSSAAGAVFGKRLSDCQVSTARRSLGRANCLVTRQLQLGVCLDAVTACQGVGDAAADPIMPLRHDWYLACHVARCHNPSLRMLEETLWKSYPLPTSYPRDPLTVAPQPSSGARTLTKLVV
ncbi:hypothetical protein Acr_07g0016350 [Actinidia rufa]|uniref:Uncharacterized protein n=1 Tax=Actinidia rufa TaxID=165716 RepID=A0A7J0EZR8_9ERIC|nr:hypothetical protein Acr_07g0016350 [Actinidia rufa]